MRKSSLYTIVLTAFSSFSCRGHVPEASPSIPRTQNFEHSKTQPTTEASEKSEVTENRVSNGPKGNPSDNQQTIASNEAEVARYPAPSPIVITPDDRSRRLEAGTGVNNGIFGPLSWVFASCKGSDGIQFTLSRSPAVPSGLGTLSRNSQSMTLGCQSPNNAEGAWICTSRDDLSLEISLKPLSKSAHIKQGETSAALSCEIKERT